MLIRSCLLGTVSVAALRSTTTAVYSWSANPDTAVWPRPVMYSVHTGSCVVCPVVGARTLCGACS